MEHHPISRPLSKFEDYIAIGFDVDHCLTRYKIRNLAKLIYDSSIELLISLYKYPDDVFKFNPCQDIFNFFGMSDLAIDVVSNFLINTLNFLLREEEI